MKRIFKIAVLIIVLVVILLAVPVASAFMGRRSIADGVEANGVHIVKDGFVSVAVVPLGQTAVALIDAVVLGDAADIAGNGDIQGSPWVFSDSQAEDRASLVRLAKLLAPEAASVKAIACAHSGVLTEGLTPLTAYAQK